MTAMLWCSGCTAALCIRSYHLMETHLIAFLYFLFLGEFCIKDGKQATEYCKNLFLQGLEIVFRVGLAILQMNQTELIQLDMEGMLQVNQPSKVCTAPTSPEAQTSTTPT